MEIDQTSIRIVFHYADDLRIKINRHLNHLEPWQVILYTLSIVFFVQWIKKVLKNEDLYSLQKWFNDMLLLIPFYKKKVEESRELANKELKETLLRFDLMKEFYKFLPDRGLSADEILNEATSYRAMSDNAYSLGRFCGASFAVEHEDPILQKLLKNIFDLYGYTNASFPDAFPSCRKMEAEVIRILCSMYHGSARSCGALTVSCTESIILACLAYCNKALKYGIRKPEMIVCKNADIAFSKAAKLLGMRIVWVGLNKKNEVNVGAIKRAIGRETCLIVASAPGFVTGVMDNIEEISKLGQRFRVPVHVDASIGGFIIPFMEQCDYPAPNFDFRFPGVCSISVDLHKYAYCMTGASAILYRDINLFQYQCYSDVNWSGGIYVSQTLSGTRSGLLIALTWATLLHNGRLGYVEKTQRIIDASCEVRRRLEEIEHFEILGDPLGPVLTFTSVNPLISIQEVGCELMNLGWTLGLLQNPSAIRLNITLNQTQGEVLDDFFDNLVKICGQILAIASVNKNTTECTTYFPSKTVSIYGLSAVFEDRGVADYLPRAYIEAYYATPTLPLRTTRTLSIEGRKISQLNMPLLVNSLRKRYTVECGASGLLPSTTVRSSSNNLEPSQK